MSFDNNAKICRDEYNTRIAEPANEDKLLTQYPNTEFTKPDPKERTTMWARFQVLEGSSKQVSLGKGTNNRYRTAGVMLIALFVPAGVGTGFQRRTADKIKLAFRSVTYSGVVFHTPEFKIIGRNGEWYQVNVSCPFHSDD